MGDRRRLAQLNRPCRAAALLIGGLNRIGESGAEITFDTKAIDDDAQHGGIAEACRIDLVERHRLAVEEEPPETFSSQRIEHGPHASRWAGRRRQRARMGCRERRSGKQGGTVVALGGIVIVCLRRAHGRRRQRHDRHIKPDQKPRTLWQVQELRRHHLCGFADDLLRALPAKRPAHPRRQQPHVVVNLGHRPDRRARVSDAVLLTNRNRWRNAVDAIDIGFLHPLEKLPRVRRQPFDIPALAFRVHRVKGERRACPPRSRR